MTFKIDKTSEYINTEAARVTDTMRWFATRNFHRDVMRQNKATIKSYADRGLIPPCTK